MNFSLDAVVWVVIVIFLISATFQTIEMKTLQNEFDEQKKGFFISEMLVSTASEYGLMEKHHGYYKKCYLGKEKIQQLLAGDYYNLLENLDVDNVKITINGQSIGVSENKAVITRYCNCEGEVCEVKVEM